MAVILHIETSTKVCSAALSKDSTCLFQRSDFQGQSHAKLLPLFLKDLIREVVDRRLSVDAVAVSCGPGSYTGLRIGVSTAKGLCYGWNIPLIAVGTLDVLSTAFLGNHAVEEDALLCPMIDARRMEVYTAFYDTNLEQKRAVQADIVDSDSYASYLSGNVYFFGDGAEKCREVIRSSNAHFVPDIYPLAEYMIPFAERAFAEKDFKDVAYFEPFYLKEFIATTPKQKI